MGFKEHQEEVDDWIRQFDPAYWPIMDQLARLTEEIGEVAREINHLYGSKKKKDSEGEGNLGQELTDVIFTIVCIANTKGINLQEEWEKMMREKHHGRDNQRYERKE